jgi:hypothetical protein
MPLHIYLFVAPAQKPGTQWTVLRDTHSVSFFPILPK